MKRTMIAMAVALLFCAGGLLKAEPISVSRSVAVQARVAAAVPVQTVGWRGYYGRPYYSYYGPNYWYGYRPYFPGYYYGYRPSYGYYGYRPYVYGYRPYYSAYSYGWAPGWYY